MSINPTSAFQFNGVISGLNTSSIVSAIMAQNSAPLKLLQNRQQNDQLRDSAYQAIQTQVQSFQSALQTLLTPSNVTGKLVSSSTSAVATATAGTNAVNGSLTLNVSRLATSTLASSSAPISLGVQPTNLLVNAGLSVAPKLGTFTVNGVQVTATSTDTLNSLLSEITDSTAGGSGVNTGVVATLVNDANGNPNFIKLTPIAGNTNAIQLGASGDTSNFLTAANLVASGVTGGGSAGAVQSGQPLSETSTGNALSTGQFQAGALASSGSFTINGATINWTDSDSLSTVLNRINSSNAGVVASYDPLHDKVTFANTVTGNQAISLSDTANGAGIGLLNALGLSNATQQYGQTAAFTVTQNGVTGATQYSNSNNVSNAVPGVSATLVGTGSTTLAVSQDTQTATNNVQAFVTQYNQLVDLIGKDTAYNSSTKSASILTGDASIRSLQNQLRSLVAGMAQGASGVYTTLASLGISTGAPGASVGSTTHLQLNTATLTTALQNNPNAVLGVFGGTNTGTLNPNGNGSGQPGNWISSATGTPFGSMYGTYKLTVDSSGNVTNVLTPTGGSALPAITSTITAGGSTAALVPGVTITAGALPLAGTTRTDTFVVGQSGVLGKLNGYLSGVLGNGGIFASEQTNTASELKSLNTQIANMNKQLAAQQQSLQSQFTAMESALAQMQGQNSTLLAGLGISPTTSSSTSSSSSSGA